MLLRLLAAASLVLLAAACSDSSDTRAETPPAEAPADAAPPAVEGEKTPAEILAGDAPYVVGPDGARGCKDRARALALIAAGKDEAKQAEYIKLWSEGMQDQSCRGFTEGLGVHVEKENEDGLDCILAIDDPENKQCIWVETGLVVKR